MSESESDPKKDDSFPFDMPSLNDAMVNLHEMYLSHQAAGFTSVESLLLISFMMGTPRIMEWLDERGK